ncbi:MAG: hypothetical protein KFF77_06700 [Bacteroidetes bacterium]|nr:hypothetical protein [Bacteroidota bacterium]
MLPNGILGIVGGSAAEIDRFLESHRTLALTEQQLRFERDRAGGGMLGCAVSAASTGLTTLSRSDDGARIGVFDGVNFDDWDIEHEPHLLPERSARDINRDANGQFLVAALGEHALDLLTDPWGTLPVYVFESRDTVAFSVSLDALRRCFISDDTVLNKAAVAQLMVFGTTFDGQTVYPGIRRLGRAMLYRARWSPSGWRLSEEEYFSPEVEPSEYRGIDNDVVDGFRAAVRKLLRKSNGDLLCTLSGGLDSRTIAAVLSAEGANVPYATHAVREGHDAIIARRVAELLGAQHHMIPLPGHLPLDAQATDFLQASNGAMSFDNYHVMWTFPEFARLGRFVMDGVHTSIEGRWFMRNDAASARNHERFFEAAYRHLRRPAILRHVRNPERHEREAREVLRRLTPDPRDYASPGCCADVFNVRTVLPNHGTDAALLENHFLRFLSPFYDREYVGIISRLSERRRWTQQPQRLIIRASAPQLATVPRAYSDILTWAVEHPLLLRVPVALERLYDRTGLARFPVLHRHLSRRAPTLGYALHADGPLRMGAHATSLFNPMEGALALPDTQTGRDIPAAMHPVLHLLLDASPAL